MADETETATLLVTTSMSVLVFGLLVLDGAAWYVQYPVLGLAVFLSFLAVVRSGSTPTTS